MARPALFLDPREATLTVNGRTKRVKLRTLALRKLTVGAVTTR